MSDFFKEVKINYADYFNRVFPLHRFALLLLIAIFVNYYFSFNLSQDSINNPQDGLILFLLKKNISYFFSSSTGIFYNISVLIYVISAISACVIHIFNITFKKFVYDLYFLLSKFDDVTKKYEKIAKNNKSSNEIINLEIAKELSQTIEGKSKILNSYNIASELFMALTFISLISLFLNIQNTAVDYIALAVSALSLVVINISSIVFYVTRYLPVYITIKILKQEEINYRD